MKNGGVFEEHICEYQINNEGELFSLMYFPRQFIRQNANMHIHGT